MNYLISLISLAILLHAGQSHPSHYGSADHAPVGYHGPLAKTVVLKSGHLADTPEVSNAKHLHYSAVQKAAAAAGYGSSGTDYDGSYSSGAGKAPVGYHGPLAKTVVLKSGHLADTPEVSHAKHLHYSAVQKASAGHSSSGADYDESYSSGAGKAPVGYHGPLAKTVVLKSGHLADTPEVSNAKHLHYSAIQKAQASAAEHGSSGADYDESYGSSSGYGGSYASGSGYSGPLANPKVLASGQLADTHEVAAARHAHLNAFAHTASEHADKWANDNNH